MKRKLTDKEVEIAQMQSIIIEWGWQFQEHVFNDYHCAESYIEITHDKDPSFIDSFSEKTHGWGRFSRLTAWKKVYKFCKHKKKCS